MGKIDLAIIIIMLIFVIFGLIKGFMKQILSVANWLLSLIGSFLFVKPFSALLSKTALSTSINGKVANWIGTKGATFNEMVEPGRIKEQISQGISELGLPKFIADAIAGGINISGSEGDMTLAEILAPSIGSIILTVLSFIILFILFMIVLKILFGFLNNVFDEGILGAVNKLLGGLLGLIKGAVLISLVMLLLSAVSGIIPPLNNFLVADLDSKIGIGKFFYEKNPLLTLIKGSFNFKDLFANIFK